MQPQMGSGPIQGQIGQMGSMSGYNQLGPQGAPAGQAAQAGYSMQVRTPRIVTVRGKYLFQAREMTAISKSGII